jgi:hypothetical protein
LRTGVARAKRLRPLESEYDTTKVFFMSRRAETRAASESPGSTVFLRRLAKLASILMIAGIMVGCTPPPAPPFAGPDPADAAAPAPAVRYRSTIGAYVSQRPAEPGAWNEQNKRAAGSPAPGHHSGMGHESMQHRSGSRRQ